MKKMLAFAVALSMIICIGIKFNVVSMNSPEDLANQALIEKWQNVNSEINKLEESLAQGDQTVLERINMLKQERKELQKNAHVHTFITMMNQAPIRAAIPAPNCKKLLQPEFIDFMYVHAFEHFLPQNDVQAIAWSPDSTKLATGSPAGTQIWDAHSGTVLDIFQLNVPVTSVAWSPDGTKVATIANNPQIAQLWNAKTGRLLHTLPHSGSVWSIAWSPDGTKLATGSRDAKIWDANSGSLLLTVHPNVRVQSVAWKPDGTNLATQSGNTVQLWNADSGILLHTLQHNRPVNSVAWSPDGTKLATESSLATIIWDANSGAPLRSLQWDGPGLRLLAWNPDSVTLATGWGQAAAIWNTDTGTTLPIHMLDNHMRVRAVAWSPDGTQLATISWYKIAKIWNTTGRLIHTLTHNTALSSMAWSPDGTKLALVTIDGIKIWNLDELNRIKRLLDAPNIDQCDLLYAIDMAKTHTGIIQATDEQWKMFTSFPQGVQQTLKLYIKAPIQRSIKEREAAFEQRQQTSASTTTEPTEESSEEQVQYIGDLLQRNVRIQEPDEPLQEQNNDDNDNDDDDDDNSLSSHGKEKDTGPRKIRRKK